MSTARVKVGGYEPIDLWPGDTALGAGAVAAPGR
jgi:hypothetical protein